jgi:3-dehydroquinate dehydratase/shikimate dehydrogenase
MMICIVINGPSYEEARKQINQALDDADLIELRLDNFASIDFDELKSLRSSFTIPMIFTLRSREQGGNYRQSEKSRLTTIRQLIALKPEYLDLEYLIDPQFIKEILLQYPTIKIILSYHNFVETPCDLEGLYKGMQAIPAHFYKIAVMANNSLDAMRLLCWAKQKEGNVVTISMGPHGQISRILAPIIKCPITYATLGENQESAPGQLPARLLKNQYRYHSLNPHTRIYGLIGDPITGSISHETHNHLIAISNLDAVYVKIQVNPSELTQFLHFARQLPFHGLSVTMPLKEQIIPFIDAIDPQAKEIGAVNTLVFADGKITGYNTDGIGALNAIEKRDAVKQKHIVIIGAGGAAKAIAYEAQRRGARITILNKSPEKAAQLACRLNSTGKGLDHLSHCVQSGYDILINCTPASLPIPPEQILPQAVAMDITTKPKVTQFLQRAEEKGCHIIHGYRMFIEQALGQFNLWTKGSICTEKSRAILEVKAEEVL